VKKQNTFSLTLTLSRPTGEGTAIGNFLFCEQRSGQHRRVVFQKNGEQFPLSHRMGEGRGEGGVSNKIYFS
jgi:hypothetical protein